MTGMHRRSDPRLSGIAALLLSLLCAGAPAAWAQIGPLEDLSSFPSARLEITVDRKTKHVFAVWLADSPARQAQGLMFVRSLPALRGMLFVHPEPRPISMWMKNTYIALDMVFIDGNGRIQQIVANTRPHSLDLVRSDRPALAVLELAGGEARRLGLAPGQQVRHPALPGDSSKR
jgi:uncharacterized protein